MIHIRWLLIFLAFFVQGCAEKFVVGERVYIGMGKDKLAFVDLKGQEIKQITDFWVHEDYLYGYRYQGLEYVLFLIDLQTNCFFEGMEAHQIVYKMGLPIDRWTNAIELFGDYISDPGRRNLFIKAARATGSGAGTEAMKRGENDDGKRQEARNGHSPVHRRTRHAVRMLMVRGAAAVRGFEPGVRRRRPCPVRL